MLRRTMAAAFVLIAAVLLMSGPAAAHVTVSTDEAEQGGFATLIFQVPNERTDAGTNRVEVTLPTDSPLAFVSVKPTPGWTATVEIATLPEPIEVFGEEITEAASTIVWEGGPLEAGQFEQFLVSVGPLPEDIDALEFPTIQTYDNGDVQRWIEETPQGGEEPEFPAPVIELTAAGGEEDGEEAATTSSDPTNGASAAQQIDEVNDDAEMARTLGLVGIGVGALGLVVAALALAAGRRRTA